MNEILVKKAKCRDKDAFVELIKEHQLSMYKVGKAILKNDEDVADAIQDTILACWEKIGTLKKHEYFKTWLIRILINNCNVMLNKKSKVVLNNELPDTQETIVDFEWIEWQDIMNCLNDKQRIVVELYYVEQFKVKEIAHILKISQSAVKSRLHKARELLEKEYIK